VINIIMGFIDMGCYNEFIAKVGEYGHKVINDYLRGRACIESVRGSVDFELLC
jgi:hypothetical protein